MTFDFKVPSFQQCQIILPVINIYCLVFGGEAEMSALCIYAHHKGVMSTITSVQSYVCDIYVVYSKCIAQQCVLVTDNIHGFEVERKKNQIYFESSLRTV